jgi:hypothetical protein
VRCRFNPLEAVLQHDGIQLSRGAFADANHDQSIAERNTAICLAKSASLLPASNSRFKSMAGLSRHAPPGQPVSTRVWSRPYGANIINQIRKRWT